MANNINRIYREPSFTENTPSIYEADNIRKIQRRGVVYVIKDQLPENELFEQMSDDLYVECIQLAMVANRRAKIFKTIQIIAAIYLIICGTVIGVLTLEGYSGSVTIYIAAILGFSISAVQTIISTFGFERRSVLLKYISHKLRKISREIKTIQSSDVKNKRKMVKLEELYSEVDDLDLSMFDSNIVSGSIKSGIGINEYQSANPNLVVLRRGEHQEVEQSEPKKETKREWSVRNLLSRIRKQEPQELPVRMRDIDIERKLQEEIDVSG